MGKRLTPEEKVARLEAWAKAKAERKAAREEKRKARLEAYEKAKAERKAKKRDTKSALDKIPVSQRVLEIRTMKPYEGHVEVGDRVCYRFLSMVFAGTIKDYKKERNYRIQGDHDEERIAQARARGNEWYESYSVTDEREPGVIYPVRRNDILAKWDGADWQERG